MKRYINSNPKMQTTVSIVTGSAQGIGKAISLALSKESTNLVLVDIDDKKLESVGRQVKKRKSELLLLNADISKVKDIEKIVKNTIAKFKKIDILVNNAGICSRRSLSEISESEWNKLMEINLKGTFFLSQNVMAFMKKQRSGKIINIASLAGKIGGIAVGADYAASKAGVISLTKSLAKDAGPYGINVNCVCPGVIRTRMTSSLPKKVIEEYKKNIPLGRIGSPEDVANAVLFLASEKADYITGEILDVNGGLLMD
ncbi:MAG: 3-oxoacyl-ACP reductase FabG [Candidatus Theseobacter exili]|nr:3-oxoacyl-ACP reductase FabG [Candidatus Theseobacter exili]